MVRSEPKHNWTNEWVYNDAVIDQAKVVWARDMSQAENQELFAYFKDRQVWVVDPDSTPAKLLPYEPVPTRR
jgi:sugar lactone lactonase YvrE